MKNYQLNRCIDCWTTMGELKTKEFKTKEGKVVELCETCYNKRMKTKDELMEALKDTTKKFIYKTDIEKRYTKFIVLAVISALILSPYLLVLLIAEIPFYILLKPLIKKGKRLRKEYEFEKSQNIDKAQQLLQELKSK